MFPDGFDGAFLCLSHEVLKLGEQLLDRIEIRAIGREEEKPGTSTSDGGAYGTALVASEVVHHDDVTRPESGEQDLLDIAAEQVAVDRSVEDARCGNSIAAQGSEEGHGFPVPLRDMGLQPLTFPAPPSDRCHVGLGPRLIDKDQPRRSDQGLILLPPIAPPGDVRSLLLAGLICFF